MKFKRRDFISISSLATLGIITNACKINAVKTTNISKPLEKLSNNIITITLSERKARISKAQNLLLENKMDALILEAGIGLYYFTGIRWWPSERTMVAIIPAKGEIKYVCPSFEEGRFREQISIGNEVNVWQEDESPYDLIAQVLKNEGILSGNVGIEEKTRFFISDGIKKAAPNLNFVSGDPITIPCRIVKSQAEIALMQKATEITIAAIKYGISQLKEGMSQTELSAIIMKTQNELGGKADFALCLFGQSAAFPHGTKQPQKLKKGDIVLMDCGCSVEGYCSDITRTVVFSAEPNARQSEIWNLVKKAQAAGFAAAKIGEPCEAVDFAARKVITDAGFGPGYKLPGFPHRTGHGIGLEGHEWGNMVKGNKQLLEAGMCFSIEPTLAIIGEFGIRIEDCVYMTEDGAKWFSQPSPNINEPFKV